MAETLVIRRANTADTGALLRLAVLDDADSLLGDVILAEVEGEIWAALEIESGRAIADPFRRSGQLVALLRMRTKRLDGGVARPERRRRLRLRPQLT